MNAVPVFSKNRLKVLPVQTEKFFSDARHYQIFFLTLFLSYGLLVLNWELSPPLVAAAFASCLTMQGLFILSGKADKRSLKSALISSLSLCLMLRTNEWWIMALAGTLSIGSKFLFRFHTVTPEKRRLSKHFFNPTNFGILCTILITGNAWISPGQWGSHGLLLFLIGICGLTVLVKVRRLDTAFAFLLAFSLLHLVRSVWVLGWPLDFFLHQFTSGTLLLFSFFMITDPAATPSHPKARILWAALTGMLAFYLATYEFVHGAPLWALFFLSPLTILLDKLFVHSKFSWS